MGAQRAFLRFPVAFMQSKAGDGAAAERTAFQVQFEVPIGPAWRKKELAAEPQVRIFWMIKGVEV